MAFSQWIKFFILLSLFSNAVFTSRLVSNFQKPDPQIYFFDIGQGDSILIQSRNDTQILIDGGPSQNILKKLGKALPFYDRTIELVILTHPDKDHLFGLIDVLKRYKVKRIMFPKVEHNTQGYHEFIKLAQEKKIKFFPPQPKARIVFSGGYMDILHPLIKFTGQKIKDSNQVSIVSRIVLKNKTILLTGDLEQKSEINLIKNNVYLASNILKVAHHGSKNSSSPIFLKAVHPQEAVISVGKNNPYGHPNPSVLKRMQGIILHRTDKEGDIIISNKK